MAQILHKRATTTHAIRIEIQRSAESAATLCRRYGINPKTVLEEAAVVTFRQKTLLPLDGCLHALQREIPSLTRSSLHRL